MENSTNSLHVTVIGTGYVGLVSGACFADRGFSVTCVDIDQKKIDSIQEGVIPIYEPGLKAIVLKAIQKEKLSFTTSIADALQKCDIAMIAVGTPQGEDGSADLQYVLAVAGDIGRYMQAPLIVVDKSTVPVGTTERVRETVAGELKKRNEDIIFDVVSNPEFLKEGSAIQDFFEPERIVVGASREESFDVMRRLYEPFISEPGQLLFMDCASAEMAKYAANSMLATRISFMNEIARICERVGADVKLVQESMGRDSRIGPKFLNSGCGYGGSCFPKDVVALEKTARDVGVEATLLKAVQEVNAKQKKLLGVKIVEEFGEDLNGLTFAVWGLSFKPETDDMREASSIVIINDIVSRGGVVKAYDPEAIHEAKEYYLKDLPVIYCQEPLEALKESDALVLITEWKVFSEIEPEKVASLMKQKYIFDGRNHLDKARYHQLDFTYHSIGLRPLRSDQ